MTAPAVKTALISGRISGVLAIVFLLCGQGLCKKQVLPAAYELLRSVRSPDQLVFPHLPPQYTVPITLSGSIADEMKKSLRDIKLDEPSYEEVLDKSRRFSLVLANKNYSLETRDLLSGVLNPVEMIDIVVSSALRYRQDDQFRAIAGETSITCTPGRVLDTRTLRFTLAPKGKYFAYSYEDLGAYIRESWLSGVTCVMDSATRCVYELTLHKKTRTFAADQTQKPPVDSTVLSYMFSYGVFDGVPLPAGLSLSIDNAPALTLGASYRREGKYLVFDARKICYVNPKNSGDGPSCLVLSYGAYEFNKAPGAPAPSPRPATYVKNIEKAAQLSRKALTLIRKGRLDAAILVLKKVAADFPDTPQAVEARKLLTGLPGGGQ